MTAPRTIVIAGAGIGGLSASLALAGRGFRVTLLDQAARLDEAGAGLQLSPNATRILIGLGLEERLRPALVAPDAVTIRSAGGRALARVPLGEHAAARYGAPYWVMHRADLQAALLDAVRASGGVSLKLGTRVEDVAFHDKGVSVACRRGAEIADETGLGLIGADGLWSGLRQRFGHDAQPLYRQRTAWRALIPADDVPEEFRGPSIHLWLGADAHLVHYPVRGGRLINIVAIVGGRFDQPGWSAPGDSAELLARFSKWRWAEPARALMQQPKDWQKWALADVPPLRRWGHGPTTLLGDAAHPMLPFMAQGAALAIEDAAVLADALGQSPDDPAAAMRRYEKARQRRTARVQRTARRNGETYHLTGAEALVRNLALRVAGGPRLLRRYDWLYGWTPPTVEQKSFAPTP